MTTPNRPLPQVKSNASNDTKLPWYRSSIVWLGIILTAVVFFACAHMLYLAAELRQEEGVQATTATDKKELTHILGVPITAPRTEPAAQPPVSE